MKIRIMSDVHLEHDRTFEVSELPDDKETVMILAGDIDNGDNATDFIAPLLKRFKAVIYVLGNHEFYGSRNRIDKVRRWWRSTQEYHDNLYVLDNDSIEIDNVRFIGTTLWTDMNNTDPLVMYDVQHDYLQSMNDYKHIKIKANGFHKLRPIDTVKLHFEAKCFIEGCLEDEYDGKTVIVTHHAPLMECVDPMYRTGSTCYAYHSNLEYMFREYDFDMWIHGHTHYRVNIDAYGKRVISNPVGYVSDPVEEFDKDLVIEL